MVVDNANATTVMFDPIKGVKRKAQRQQVTWTDHCLNISHK
jgi:hypothetical protein